MATFKKAKEAIIPEDAINVRNWLSESDIENLFFTKETDIDIKLDLTQKDKLN